MTKTLDEMWDKRDELAQELPHGEFFSRARNKRSEPLIGRTRAYLQAIDLLDEYIAYKLTEGFELWYRAVEEEPNGGLEEGEKDHDS